MKINLLILVLIFISALVSGCSSDDKGKARKEDSGSKTILEVEEPRVEEVGDKEAVTEEPTVGPVNEAGSTSLGEPVEDGAFEEPELDTLNVHPLTTPGHGDVQEGVREEEEGVIQPVIGAPELPLSEPVSELLETPVEGLEEVAKIEEFGALKVSILNTIDLLQDERLVFMALINDATKEYKILSNPIYLGDSIEASSFVIPFSFFKEHERLLQSGGWRLVVSSTHEKHNKPFWVRNRSSYGTHFFPLDGWLEPLKNEERLYEVLDSDDLRACTLAEACSEITTPEPFTTKRFQGFIGIELSAELITESESVESFRARPYSSLFEHEGSL